MSFFVAYFYSHIMTGLLLLCSYRFSFRLTCVGCELLCNYLRIIIEEHVRNLHLVVGVVDGSRDAADSQHAIFYQTWRNTGDKVTVCVTQ